MKGKDVEIRDIIVRMSRGNPGALTVLCEIAKRPDGEITIHTMAAMGMVGSLIWIGYKDHCKEDLDAFVKAIGRNDRGLRETINREIFTPTNELGPESPFWRLDEGASK